MYLLDTDILIWILRGRQDIIDYVSRLKDKSTVGLSVISVAEIYMNVFPSELINTEEHLEQYILFNVDEKVAKLAGLYWQQHSKKLKKLGITDCLIAATANMHEVILVTLNEKHFPMKDIQLLNPSK